MATGLNLFKDENKRTEESIRQQKRTTRIYLILVIGAFLVLVLFTSLKTDTSMIIITNPLLIDYKALQNQDRDELKCPCSSMTIPYQRFLSLSPTLHQVCSSDFVRDPWISITMSIIFQHVSTDWRNQGGPQFQLLSDLCHLANKTIEDAIRRFLAQSFISSNVLSEEDFETQFNATLDQFIESTTTYFGQITDTVDLLMRVDQPLIQTGSTKAIHLRNIFVRPPPDNKNLSNETDVLKLGYSLLGTHDVNSTSINCICATNPHCQSLVGIYSNHLFVDSPSNPDLAYIVPGFIEGCFIINSLMLSTLECFYPNSDCISVLSGFIEEPYHQSTDYPRPIDIQPLVDDALSSRFRPKSTIASIVREMMIEKWNPSISYHNYYDLCAPSYCAYSTTLRTQTNIGIITILLSTIGGLCTSLKLITPYLFQIVHHLFRWVSHRRNHHDQQHQEGQLTRFNRLKSTVQQMMVFFYTKLSTLNLFTVQDFGSHVNRITARHLGQWATRLYLILFNIGIAILVLYTIIQPQTLTETFDKPSLNEYNRLKYIHGEKLQCSCSLIASKYNHFIHIEPVFHQICSSEFVSNEWQTDLIAGFSANLSVYSTEDYRLFLPAHLQFLRRLCELSIQSVNNSIDQFLSSLFVTSQLQSQTLFHTQLHSQIKQRESNTSDSLSQLLILTGDINDGNTIISTYATNFQHIVVGATLGAVYADTQAMTYDNNCSCGLYQNCTTQANFIQTNSLTKIRIKGLKMGCTPSESFRASTLECFYDSSCINLLYKYTNYTNTIKSRFISVPLRTNRSRFSINATIAQLTNDLFTEVWKTTMNYSSYFKQCAPSVCSYTYIQKLNSLYTVTLLFGLQGGLSFVLEWICPKFVRIIFKIHQRWRRRTNVIQPIVTISSESNAVVKTDTQQSITNSEPISTDAIYSTRISSPIRCTMRLFLTCLFVLFVIAGLSVFSIYFIRQAKHQVTPIVSEFNTTTDTNSNLRTTESTSTSMMSTTTVSTCQLEFQPIAIALNTSYRVLSPVVADFNDDGRSDVAVLVDFDRRVQVLYGDKNGTFRSQMTIPEVNNYCSLAVGDFNNDRHIDLVYSAFFDNFLGVWLGNGDGTFQPSIVFWSGSEDISGDIYVAHFNKDNYLDVIVSHYWQGQIYVFFGNGDGSFTELLSNPIFIEDSKVSTNVGDFNNDGYSDFVVSDRANNYIVVFLGYGDGTFERQKRMFTGPNFIPESVIVGDLNGDHQADIAFSYNERNAVSIMFGHGNGTFNIKQNFHTEKRSASRPSVVLSDLNEDGLLDIITDGADPYCIDVLLGQGNGSFKAQRIFSIQLRSEMTSGLIIGDFNGDGHEDILGAKNTLNHLNVLLNTCNCCTSKTNDVPV